MMNRMKQKVALVAVAVMLLLPMTIYAEFTSLTVGGMNALEQSSGTGWSYDANSSTLTISGNIGTSESTLAINAVTAANSQDVLHIWVTGDATITGGIYAGGKLKLEVATNKTLTVNYSGSGAAIASGYKGVEDSVYIYGGGTVVALGSGNANGIQSGGGLKIEGVTVAAQGRNYGLDSGSGRLYIKDNSKVYAVSSLNTAIVAPSTENHDVVEISGDNTVVVAGFALGDASNDYAPTTRTSINNSIHAGTVTVNCGHLIIGGGFSATTFTLGSMTKVTDSSDNYAEYIGHLNYQQNSGSTHTQKCADGCPVTYTGTAEACSDTIYCTGTVCDKCDQTSGSGDATKHKGGTATCTAKAKCELCQTEYGELAPSNHTGTVSGDYTYVDGTYHSAVFSCCGTGGASANQEHTPSTENKLICSECSGLAIDKVLEEIKNAPSGTTLSYSGVLGSQYSAYNKSITMEIPEGVIVNWGVTISGNFSSASLGALLTLSGGGTLNLTGTIKNTATTNQNACIALAAGSNVTLVVSGGTVSTASSSASAIKAAGGKEVRVESGTVSGTTGIYSFGSANVTVTGGSVTGTGNAISVTSATPGLVTVSGGTVTAGETVISTDGGAVAVSGSPTINGTNGGTSSAAIYAGSVEISGSPTITHSNGDGIKMYQYGPVVFKEDCDATVFGGQYGINDGLVTVEQGAKATVTGWRSGNGILYSGSDTITVNGELTVKSNSTSYDVLRASNATITVGTSGKLTAESESTSGDGIECKELQVSGTVDATGGTTSGNGVYTTTKLTINGGTVTASGYNAVYCSGKISVTGGVLRANGDRIGIWPSSMEVNGDSHIVGTGDFKGVSCTNIEISDDHYWYVVAEADKPTDLHGYTRGGLSSSDANDKTYFELITEAHIAAASDGKGKHSLSCSADCPLAVSGAAVDCTGGSYSAEGDTITDNCSVCGYDCGTATITATNAIYDGTAQETATVAYGTGWTGDRGLTPTYENNVNAGTATASITFGGVTARATFTILPKEITGATVATQGSSLVYSGEPLTPEVSVTLDSKTLAATDYQVSYDDNVNAGQATVTVTGTGNYSGSATTTFTIDKAPAPTLPAIKVSRNYAATKVSVPTGIVAGEGSTVSVGAASGSGAGKVSNPALDDKGNLTFTLSGGANGETIELPVSIQSPNYEGTITATVTVTLTDKLDQRPLTVKATGTTVPSGGRLELSTSGGSGKGAVTYEVIKGTGSASVSGSTLTGEASGTVTVIATKEGTGQYNPARSQPLVITIE